MSSAIDTQDGREALQAALAHAGFYHGAIDGILGPQTAQAIIAARTSYNLSSPTKPIYDIALEGKLGMLVIQSPETSSVATILLPLILNPILGKFIPMPFLPTIVQILVSLLPGIPDDINIVEAELKELASTDSGKVKLQTALEFGKTLIAKIEAVLAAN